MKKSKENPKITSVNPNAKKIPRATRDFIPSNMIKYLRENIPISCPNKLNETCEYVPFAKPFPIPHEWTYSSTEEVNKDIFSLDPDGHIYSDPLHNELLKNLPLTFLQATGNDIQWIRPEEYIRNNNIDREIKRLYPKKKYLAMREDIKDTYRNKKEPTEEEIEENNVEDYLKSDSGTLKKNIYKDFYQFLESKEEIRVVNWRIREESDEEYTKRKNEEMQEKIREEQLLKSQKKGNVKDTPGKFGKKPTFASSTRLVIPEKERLKMKECIPSVLDLNEFSRGDKPAAQSTFHGWLASIFQLIIDLEIPDVLTGTKIFMNIYPQKEGIPVYNPKGKYIIKLYFMGKPRKIEIDDRIPCNKDQEYILPQCKYLTEIWPALLIKALLKLNMYKTRHPLYYYHEESTDPSFIYALTGYHAEIVDLEKRKDEGDFKLLGVCERILSEDTFLEKKNYLICYKKVASNNKESTCSFESVLEDFKARTGRGSNDQNMAEIKEEKEKKISSDGGKSSKMILRSIKRNNTISRFDIENFIRKKNESSKISGSNVSQLEKKLSLTNLRKLTRGSSIIASSPNERNELISQDNNLIFNFAYSICDFFDNQSFNMKRLKPIDFSDLRQEIKNSTVCFKQLPPNEKKLYIAYRRELKAKQLEEKTRRIEELKNEGKKYNLVRIKNEAMNGPKITSVVDYNEEEIYMAKKCIINNWSYPPVSFYEKYFEASCPMRSPKNTHHEENDGINEEVSLEVSKIKNRTNLFYNRDTYLQLISNNVEQYFIQREPVIRQNGGIWVSFQEFKRLFNRFIILYNPVKLYQSRFICDNNWYWFKTDVFEPLEEYAVFYLNSSSIDMKLFSYSMLVVFEPNSEQVSINAEKVNSYLALCLVDSQGKIIKNDVILNNFYSTFVYSDLSGASDYYLLIKGGVFPLGYMLQVYSESHYLENMTYSTYLKKVMNFSMVYFKVEHPVIAKNKFHLISRCLITPTQGYRNPGNIRVKISVKYPIKYVKPYVEIYLQKGKSQNKYQIYPNEVIDLENLGSSSCEDVGGCPYYLIFSIRPPQILKENVFEIEILHDNTNYIIEQIEHISPYEVSDLFIPNRHGIIFKEYIYASDVVHCSFDIQLRSTSGKISVKEGASMIPIPIPNPIPNPNTTSHISSSGSTASQTRLSQISLIPFIIPPEEKEIEDKIPLKLELYSLTNYQVPNFTQNSLKFSYTQTGTLISSWEFFTSTVIHHLRLEGNLISVPQVEERKKKNFSMPDASSLLTNITNQPYLLICYCNADQTLPKYLTSNNLSIEDRKLGWTIRIFSSDTIGIVKDTSKEDFEKTLKESWEMGEQGRAERAKRARLKYMISNKKEKGLILSKDEEMMLKEERERKIVKEIQCENKQMMLNANNIKKASGNLQNPNMKSPVKLLKKPSMVSEKSEVSKRNSSMNIQTRPLPVPESHTSEYIKEYLTYAYTKRTLKLDGSLDQSEKVIIDSNVKSKKQNEICINLEEFEKNKKDAINTVLFSKSELSENLRSFYKTSSSLRSSSREDCHALLKHRENLKNELQTKLDMEKAVNNIILSHSQNNYDVNFMVNVYKDSLTYLGIDHKPLQRLFAIISTKKEDIIKAELKKLTQKDKPYVIKILEDIEFNKWKISDGVILQLKDLIR